MILHIPHSSTKIPDDVVFDKDITEDLLRMTDHATDVLFSYSATDVVVFQYSRLFCDVERLLENEPMEEFGHGVCYTRDSFGGHLRFVSAEERECIIENYYKPHHRELEIACNRALALFDSIVIVDCHSFSNTVLPHEVNTLRPDFCLGTDDFHSPAELVEEIKLMLESKGYQVELNAPFAGTIVPLSHYRKTSSLKSIMIEVNRKLYVGTSAAEYQQTKSAVDEALKIISDYESRHDVKI